MALYGGIEAGGTKFVCAVGTGPDDIRAEVRFPTATPEESISKAIAFFREYQQKEPLDAIGVACLARWTPICVRLNLGMSPQRQNRIGRTPILSVRSAKRWAFRLVLIRT